LQVGEGGCAFGGGAGAEEDVVIGVFGEELGGELEADAAVGCAGVRDVESWWEVWWRMVYRR
jgi:hypothetical protein